MRKSSKMRFFKNKNITLQVSPTERNGGKRRRAIARIAQVVDHAFAHRKVSRQKAAEHAQRNRVGERRREAERNCHKGVAQRANQQRNAAPNSIRNLT